MSRREIYEHNERLHIMLRDFPKDLALVILLTLACIPFVLVPPLNETPVRVLLGLLLVLFLPGYSLIAALFPAKDDLDGIERITLSFWAWASQSCRCSGWH